MRNGAYSDPKDAVNRWNNLYPDHTAVRWWRNHQGKRTDGRGHTQGQAFLSASGEAVIFVNGCVGYLPLSHVEVI